MLERKGGNWLPFNAQLDLSTTKALISKSVINTKEIYFLEKMPCMQYFFWTVKGISIICISFNLFVFHFEKQALLYVLRTQVGTVQFVSQIRGIVNKSLHGCTTVVPRCLFISKLQLYLYFRCSFLFLNVLEKEAVVAGWCGYLARGQLLIFTLHQIPLGNVGEKFSSNCQTTYIEIARSR